MTLFLYTIFVKSLKQLINIIYGQTYMDTTKKKIQMYFAFYFET